MASRRAQELVADKPACCNLYLFGGPYVRIEGRRLEMPEGTKRLVVFLALHPARLERRFAAGSLWPMGDEERAAGNLRTALWRLKKADIDVVEADKHSLSLYPDVTVDTKLISEWADRLIHDRATPDDLASVPGGASTIDLLPGWYDDWVLFERESLRQRVLHALEAMAIRLIALERFPEAVMASMIAVRADPFRESAQRALIQSHLAEGNWIEGQRTFDDYRQLLWRELGIRPSAMLSRLVRLPVPPLLTADL